ncbi:MAG: sigma 54-interacting transcriptional regulator [Polyangiaceae bacterium]
MSTGFEEDATRRVSVRDRGLPVLSVDVLVVGGPARGARFTVRNGVARIGSAPGNDVRIDDATVSRQHCEIRVRADAVLLRDLSSTNGTYVGGARIREAEIPAGTLVRAGDSAFQILVGDGPTFLELSSRTSFGELVGASVEMRRLYALLERVATTDTTVLVTGETGTGKDVVARSIHAASRRAAGPFVPIDCGAIPESLIESELFGHVRGAFSGAIADRRGVFEEAGSGTLFLDEIGEMPMALQPKLLRALETRTVRPVGASGTRPVDVRIVAATNRSLARCVNDGTFREDLYYRLAVVEAPVPALRDRPEDVPILAAHFYKQITRTDAAPPPDFLRGLASRSWPGNVRELRNFVERSVSLGMVGASGPVSAPPVAAEDAELAVPIHLPLKDARQAWIESFELVYVRRILEKTGGNVTRAAQMAGVSRRFLQRLIVRLGPRARALVSNLRDLDDDG